MAYGKFDFRLLTDFATRSFLISSMKSFNLSLKHGHAPRFMQIAIENINSHKDCTIIAAGVCEIRVKSDVVAWSQCIQGTGE